MLELPQTLIAKLAFREKEDNLKSLGPVYKSPIDFCTNDYLGIARELTKNPSFYKHSGGATGSRLISGNSKSHQELETFLAHYYNAKAGVLYGSGYTANLGVISCVPQKGDLVLYDEYIHASLRDGMQMTLAKCVKFKHNDTSDLYSKIVHLKDKTEGEVYILLESLYSMDGDIAPLEKIIGIAKTNSCHIILDEAHGTGVLGKNKKGLYADYDSEDIFIRIHTFGKGLGSHGAIVLGSKELIKYLINFSRPFIYTTAMPQASLDEIKAAHLLFDEFRVDQSLDATIKYFNYNVKKNTLKDRIPHRLGPIQTYFNTKNTLIEIANKALDKGIYLKPIFAPTVPKGQERIRIVLHAYNTVSEIDALIKILKNE